MQEAYDLIKWWETCDPDGHYDWGDLSLPYLTIKGKEEKQQQQQEEEADSTIQG